jgi:hypothetical protein
VGLDTWRNLKCVNFHIKHGHARIMGSLDSRRDEDLELYIDVDSWRRMIILKVIGLFLHTTRSPLIDILCIDPF